MTMTSYGHENSPMVTLEAPLEFQAPDGSTVIAGPGHFTVEAADSGLRLISDQGSEIILLTARPTTHEEVVDRPKAVVQRLKDERYELVLFLLNGRSLEAIGLVIARLVALVPKPLVNLTRSHGVFAPNSKYRTLVTPAKRGRGKTVNILNDQTPAEKRAWPRPASRPVPGLTFSMTWAKRLKRVFNIDKVN